MDHAPPNHRWRRRIFYLMVKIAAEHEALPDTLFLAGTIFHNVEKPWRFGGLADIFRGTYNKVPVVGKRLRVSDDDARKKYIHKVRLVTSVS
jgi:hypothetical protein